MPERWLPDATEAPRLIGSRVWLRAPHEGDVDALFELFGDPATMRYWSRPPMRERGEARARLQEMRAAFAARTHLAWVIALADGDACVGTCTLFAIDLDHRRAEIGYALSSRLWGRGLAREALTLARDFAFGPLALARLEADIDPRNSASIALAERLGFEREGLLRARWRVAGEVQDSAIYGLLAASMK
jgi:RimJ/RimL family protein N-acetyltransferase